MKVEFFCWKCNEVLFTVPGEYFTLNAYLLCPAPDCGEPNGVSYAFPQGRHETS